MAVGILIVVVLLSKPNFALTPLKFNTDTFSIVNGSSVMASTPSFSVKFVVLASFAGKNDILLVSDILECESGVNHYNKDGTIKRGKAGEYGIAQFMPKTWAWLNKIRGTNLDIYNEAHQLDLFVWAIKNGYQNHWTCWYKASY